MLVLKGLAVIWGIAIVCALFCRGVVEWMSLFAQTPGAIAEAKWNYQNRKENEDLEGNYLQ